MWRAETEVAHPPAPAASAVVSSPRIALRPIISLRQAARAGGRYSGPLASDFRLADTAGGFRELDQWIRRRMLALQLKHWKRGRTARAVGIKAATEGGRGVLKLRAQPNGRSRLIDGKRFFAHHGLTVSKARGIEVEEFGGGVVGFRLPEEVAGGDAADAETPVKATKVGGRRKAAGG